MKPLLIELEAAPGLARSLSERLDLEPGTVSRRQFPDGETYLRFESLLKGRDVLLLCTLDRPDPKVLPLLFAAASARQHGAASVGLIAPYLAYMRQDKEFRSGEAVTSEIFARLISSHVDWLVAVDPHLHRHPTLKSVYSVPAHAAHAADPIAEWIRREVERPVVIGPDEESAQWVQEIASRAGTTATALRKVRSGDYSVSIDPGALPGLEGTTPVVVDDIAASGRTLIETVRLLRGAGTAAPICAVVHPIFAGNAYRELFEAGARLVVSTNTVAHPSNVIDVAAPLSAAVSAALAQRGIAA